MKKFILWLKSLYNSEAKKERQEQIIKTKRKHFSKKIANYRKKAEPQEEEYISRTERGYIANTLKIKPLYLLKPRFTVFQRDEFIKLMNLVTGEEIQLKDIGLYYLEPYWVYKNYFFDIRKNRLYYTYTALSVYQSSNGSMLGNYFVEMYLDESKQINKIYLYYSYKGYKVSKYIFKYTDVKSVTRSQILCDIKDYK